MKHAETKRRKFGKKTVFLSALLIVLLQMNCVFAQGSTGSTEIMLGSEFGSNSQTYRELKIFVEPEPAEGELGAVFVLLHNGTPYTKEGKVVEWLAQKGSNGYYYATIKASDFATSDQTGSYQVYEIPPSGLQVAGNAGDGPLFTITISEQHGEKQMQVSDLASAVNQSSNELTIAHELGPKQYLVNFPKGDPKDNAQAYGATIDGRDVYCIVKSMHRPLMDNEATNYGKRYVADDQLTIDKVSNTQLEQVMQTLYWGYPLLGAGTPLEELDAKQQYVTTQQMIWWIREANSINTDNNHNKLFIEALQNLNNTYTYPRNTETSISLSMDRIELTQGEDGAYRSEAITPMVVPNDISYTLTLPDGIAAYRENASEPVTELKAGESFILVSDQAIAENDACQIALSVASGGLDVTSYRPVANWMKSNTKRSFQPLLTVDGTVGTQTAKLQAVTVESNKPKGEITLIKQSEGDSAVVLAGAEFELYRLNDSSEPTMIAEKLITDEQGGIIKADNLLAGNYYFKEVVPPTGYDLPKPTDNQFAFTLVEENGQVTVASADSWSADQQAMVITNKASLIPKGEVSLIKQDKDTARTLQDAEFKLFKVESNGDVPILNGEEETFVTDQDGKITVGNLLAGTYYFTETKQPAGYIAPDASNRYEFTLSNSETAVVAEGQAQLLELQVADGVVQDAAGALVVSNEPVKSIPKGEVSLLKQDRQDQSPLAGAKFALYKQSVGTEEYELIQNGSEQYFVTEENGILTAPGLEVGAYYFQEVQAPEGYEKPAADVRYEFALAVSTDASESNKLTLSTTVPLVDGRLVVENQKAAPAEIELLKTDVETGVSIAGATFYLYRVEDGGSSPVQPADAGHGEYGYVTNDSGRITVSGLPAGEYYFEEVIAAPGYDLPEQRQTDHIVITADNGVLTAAPSLVTFQNKKTSGSNPTPDNPTPDNPTPDNPTPDNPTPDNPTPDNPTPDNPTPDNPTPDNPTPDNPTPTPEPPVVDNINELPDANDPVAPPVVMVIDEQEVPRAYYRIWAPEEEAFVYIPEEDVPLGVLPDAGGVSSPYWLFLLAGLALCTLGIRQLKRDAR